MGGMFRDHERVENGCSVVVLQATIGGHRSFAFALGASVHQRDAVAGAKKNKCVFEYAHAIVRDAMEEQHPGTIGRDSAHFPAAQENAIGCAYVKRLAVNADLREGSVGLLDEIGGEWAAHGVQEGRRDEPADDHGDQRRSEKKDEEDAQDSLGHGSFKDTSNGLI